ncbi:MAG: alpha/beta fold hydrolase [Myxococcales bacterium]|nr:alpha/beta fold hydrolase [Myxococcales bacterium]
MKPNADTRLYRKLLPYLLLCLLWTAAACDADNSASDTPSAEPHSATPWKTYSLSQVQSTLQMAALLFPELQPVAASASHDVTVYQVTYATTLGDAPITASGLLSIPHSQGDFPILSFQNGTNTCHAQAPSANPDAMLYNIISFAASLGYIVAIPDYIGFGASDQVLHPYHHRASSDRAVVDFIRTTQAFLQASDDLPGDNGQLLLMGYSQGGWATLSALSELEAHPLPGLTPVAAACGAGAYDLLEMGHHILETDAYPEPFFLPYFIHSHQQNGFMPGTLNDYFTAPYAADIPALFDGELCNASVNAALPDSLDDWLTPHLRTSLDTADDATPLRAALTQNSVDPWAVQTPLRLYHSPGDQTVPFWQSELCHERLLAAGTAPERIDIITAEDADATHTDATMGWGVDTLRWFQSLDLSGH